MRQREQANITRNLFLLLLKITKEVTFVDNLKYELNSRSAHC